MVVGGHVFKQTHFLLPHQDKTFICSTPTRVKLGRREISHQGILCKLSLGRHLGMMLELAVNCLGVVVFFVITDNRFSGVSLDTTIEHQVDKALLLFKKCGTINSRRDVGAIEDITKKKLCEITEGFQLFQCLSSLRTG